MSPPSRRAYLLGLSTGITAALTGCLSSDRSSSEPASTTNEPPATGSSPESTPSETASVTSPGTGPTDDTESAGPQTQPPTEGTTQSEETTSTESATPATELNGVTWQFDAVSPVEATPLPAGDTVYVGTEDGTIQAVSATDGTTRWTKQTEKPVQTVAAEEDGFLVVHTGGPQLASGHVLHVLDAASGEELWTFSPTDWWLEVLDVRDGTVYVSTADDALGGENQRLYALTLSDGTREWDAEVGDPRDSRLTSDALTVVCFGRTYTFDPETGEEFWSVGTEDVTHSTVGVVGGIVVYVVETRDADVYSKLVARDLNTGENVWTYDESGVTSTTIHEGGIYAGGRRVVALDPADGSIRWQADDRGFLPRSPVLNGNVFAGGDDVRAYDMEDGTVHWTWEPDPAQRGVVPAETVGETLFVEAWQDSDPRNAYRFAVDGTDGVQHYAFTDDTELSDVAAGTDRSYVGGENGRVYALATE